MVEGVNSSMIYLIYYKNFVNHNVLTPSTTIKKGIGKNVLEKHEQD
jgi:hypothetical protein